MWRLGVGVGGIIASAIFVCLLMAQDRPSSSAGDGSADPQLVLLLNQKLAAAAEARDAGDWKKAISLLKEATDLAPDKDLIWFKLGDAYRGAEQYQDAVAAYNSAIALKQLAAYYNNLGEAESKLGNVGGAVQAYRNAARLDPEKAGQFYFNIGAIETNARDFHAANAAFDDTIKADPTYPAPYYFKGLNLLSDALTVRGKAEVSSEVSELFQKYLELAPEGPYVDTSREALALISREIVTSYKREGASDSLLASMSVRGRDAVPSDAVSGGGLMRQQQPFYPELARTARIEGTVTLNAVVAEDGKILSLDLVSGNPFLVESALNAVREWQYKPYLLLGRPIPVWMTVTVNFKLTPTAQGNPAP